MTTSKNCRHAPHANTSIQLIHPLGHCAQTVTHHYSNRQDQCCRIPMTHQILVTRIHMTNHSSKHLCPSSVISFPSFLIDTELKLLVKNGRPHLHHLQGHFRLGRMDECGIRFLVQMADLFFRRTQIMTSFGLVFRLVSMGEPISFYCNHDWILFPFSFGHAKSRNAPHHSSGVLSACVSNLQYHLKCVKSILVLITFTMCLSNYKYFSHVSLMIWSSCMRKGLSFQHHNIQTVCFWCLESKPLTLHIIYL